MSIKMPVDKTQMLNVNSFQWCDVENHLLQTQYKIKIKEQTALQYNSLS